MTTRATLIRVIIGHAVCANGLVINAKSNPSRHAAPCMAVDPSTLPGDPSLVLTTNVKISSKVEFMQACSKAIASCLSKPESYVAVCVNDEASVIWAGIDTPCALGCVYSM